MECVKHSSTGRGTEVLLWPIAASLAAFAAAGPAFATCVVTSGPNTVNCATDTTTSNTTNTNGATNASSDRKPNFTTNGNVTATVASGVTVDGFGLKITSGQVDDVTVVNNGAIEVDTGNAASGAFSVTTVKGDVSYSGSGSVANNGTGSGISILFTSSGSPPTSGSLNLNAGGVLSSNTGNGISSSGFMGPAVLAISADVTGNALGTASDPVSRSLDSALLTPLPQ